MISPTAWQKRALHDLEHTRDSYQTIADRYGRHRQTIILLCKRHGIKRPEGAGHRPGPAPLDQAKPISAAHRMVAVHLNLAST